MENKWKRATLILLILLFGVLVYSAINQIIETRNSFSDEYLCSQIQVTPSWMHHRGTLITTGYKELDRYSAKEFVDILIEDQVRFMYSPLCSWCKKQIEEFGEEWERYEQTGLPIDCDKFKGGEK